MSAEQPLLVDDELCAIGIGANLPWFGLTPTIEVTEAESVRHAAVRGVRNLKVRFADPDGLADDHPVRIAKAALGRTPVLVGYLVDASGDSVGFGLATSAIPLADGWCVDIATFDGVHALTKKDRESVLRQFAAALESVASGTNEDADERAPGYAVSGHAGMVVAQPGRILARSRAGREECLASDDLVAALEVLLASKGATDG